MATQQNTVAFILDQMAAAGTLAAKKLFVEYGLYCDGKLFALICDDQLFIKPPGAPLLAIFLTARPTRGRSRAFSCRATGGTNATGWWRWSRSRSRRSPNRR